MTFLSAALPPVAGLDLNILQICMRLTCAMMVGMIIGIEREYTHRPAGMRTHILVALGSCAVMITGQLIFAHYQPYGSTPDPARLSAQVITGVGFLGAGTIMREGVNVKGLTTAASLWAVACLGIAAGGGYYTVSLVGMVFIFITLTLLEVLQNSLVRPRVSHYYSLKTQDLPAALNAVNRLAEKHKCALHELQCEVSDGAYLITFRAESKIKKKQPRVLFESLAKEASIVLVKETDEPVGTI